MTANERAFDAWLDRFFAHYYATRPVNATFIGVHDHDHALPDFSPAATARQLAEMRQLRAGIGADTDRGSRYWPASRRPDRRRLPRTPDHGGRASAVPSRKPRALHLGRRLRDPVAVSPRCGATLRPCCRGDRAACARCQSFSPRHAPTSRARRSRGPTMPCARRVRAPTTLTKGCPASPPIAASATRNSCARLPSRATRTSSMLRGWTGRSGCARRRHGLAAGRHSIAI